MQNYVESATTYSVVLSELHESVAFWLEQTR